MPCCSYLFALYFIKYHPFVDTRDLWKLVEPEMWVGAMAADIQNQQKMHEALPGKRVREWHTLRHTTHIFRIQNFLCIHTQPKVTFTYNSLTFPFPQVIFWSTVLLVIWRHRDHGHQSQIKSHPFLFGLFWLNLQSLYCSLQRKRCKSGTTNLNFHFLFHTHSDLLVKCFLINT